MPEQSSLLVLQVQHKLEEKVSVCFSWQCVGTQRRKKKHVNVQNVNEDKKLKSAIKKFGKLSISPES